MDKQKIQEYKKRLEEERKRLISKIDGGQHEDFGSDVDMDEEADEAESFGEQLAINHGLRERVAEIDAALNRIRKGTYGKCENCGKEIGGDVLKISPESSICQSCKKKE